MSTKEKISGLALLPFAVFIAVFLGCGIILKDFYMFPAPVAALCGVISAFFIPRYNFKDKLKFLLDGVGDHHILTMGGIFLLAGAFASVSKAIGSVDAVVSFGMQYFSAEYVPLGIFLVASFLSISAGTSVGTIVALSPVVFALADGVGLDINLIGATLLCGAMFGDNLSFISDTTIAATQTMNCRMKDKFKENIKLALPASLLASLFFLYLGSGAEISEINRAEIVDSSYWLIVPYFFVILMAMLGVNVFVVLMLGIFLSGFLGVFLGVISWLDFSKKIYEGFLGMNDIFLLALFTGGLAGIVENMGGIDYLLNKIKKLIRGKKTAYLGIGGLVALANIAVANNTISIVLTGKVARKITEEQQLNPKVSASILDVFSCIVQGLIPYGVQVLILVELSGNKIDYLSMLRYTWYIYFLFAFAVIYILFQKNKKIRPDS